MVKISEETRLLSQQPVNYGTAGKVVLNPRPEDQTVRRVADEALKEAPLNPRPLQPIRMAQLGCGSLPSFEHKAVVAYQLAQVAFPTCKHQREAFKESCILMVGGKEKFDDLSKRVGSDVSNLLKTSTKEILRGLGYPTENTWGDTKMTSEESDALREDMRAFGKSSNTYVREFLAAYRSAEIA